MKATLKFKEYEIKVTGTNEKIEKWEGDSTLIDLAKKFIISEYPVIMPLSVDQEKIQISGTSIETVKEGEKNYFVVALLSLKELGFDLVKLEE